MTNAMIPGLNGTKMSSSVPDSKIEFLDTQEEVYKKVQNATCEDGVVSGNGLLALLKEIILPIRQYRSENQQSDDANFTVTQVNDALHSSKYYQTYEELEGDFRSKQIKSNDLKRAVIEALEDLLEPLRRSFNENKEWQEADKLAYSED